MLLRLAISVGISVGTTTRRLCGVAQARRIPESGGTLDEYGFGHYRSPNSEFGLRGCGSAAPHFPPLVGVLIETQRGCRSPNSEFRASSTLRRSPSFQRFNRDAEVLRGSVVLLYPTFPLYSPLNRELSPTDAQERCVF